MKPPSVQLREVVQHFIRELGLLTTERTPCGQAMPVSEAHALIQLLSHTEEECLTAKDLARFLKIDKSNVSRMCSRMETAGLLNSVPCEKDGRVKRLVLTEKGKMRAANVMAAGNQRFERVVAAMPDGRPDAVVHALRTLIEAMEIAHRVE